MDKHKTSWILDFLLQQPLDSWVINRCISILPVADDDVRLKKGIILRGIGNEILNNSISEIILELFEEMEHLLHAGSAGRVPDSMKVAYRAVVAECTVRNLREGHENADCLVSVIDRVWKDRLHEMERANSCRVMLEEFKDSLKEMAAAVTGDGAWEALLGRNTKKEALDFTRIFWEEAMREMGPSFLESQAKIKCQRGENKKLSTETVVSIPGVNVCPVAEYLVPPEDDPETLNVDYRIPPLSTDKDVCEKGSSPGVVSFTCDCHSKEKEVELCRTIDHDANSGRTGVQSMASLTCQVKQQQKALISVCNNLTTVVEDPLPKAIEVASRLLFREANESLNGRLPGKSLVQGSRYDHTGPPEQKCELIPASKPSDGNPDGKIWHGFMARYPTARTYEWDDDVSEPSSEHSPNASKKIHLPTPKRRVISPLRIEEAKKFVRRRMVKRWTTLEEETLRRAVSEHGRGSWKNILKSYKDVFEDRTEVDLKDKWRNMIR